MNPRSTVLSGALPRLAAAFALIAALGSAPGAARADSAVSFLPKSGHSSECAGVIKKRIKHGAHDEKHSESWSRKLAIRGAEDAIIYDLGVTLHLDPDVSTSFSEKMSRSAPQPIDARATSEFLPKVAVFAASFPEHFLYGKTLALGDVVTPLPEFRSDYSREMIDSGFVVEDLDRVVRFAREEALEGAPTYVFEARSTHDVRIDDGQHNVEVASATYWIDQATLLLRRAALERRKSFNSPQSPSILIHEDVLEWRCAIDP